MARKGCVVVLIVVLVLAGAGFLVYRNGVHPGLVLAVVNWSWERTRDMDAVVTGEAEVMGFQVTGGGRLRFLKPDLYDLDLTQLRLVAGTEQLWLILPAFKTAVRVTGEGMTPAQMLESVVAGWEGSNPAGWVKEASARPGEVTLYKPTVVGGERCWVLEWPARTGERIGGRLYVSQKTRGPVQFDQMDSAGQVMSTYRVTQFRRNTGLEPGDFDYQPMTGYATFSFNYDPDDPAGFRRLEEELRRQAGPLQEMLRRAPDLLPPGLLDDRTPAPR